VDYLNDESIYTKLNALKESLIAQRFSTLLLNAKKFHNIKVLNASHNSYREVKGISIKGNIFIIFLLVVGLWVLNWLVFLTENLVRRSVLQRHQLLIAMRHCRLGLRVLLHGDHLRWMCRLYIRHSEKRG